MGENTEKTPKKHSKIDKTTEKKQKPKKSNQKNTLDKYFSPTNSQKNSPLTNRLLRRRQLEQNKHTQISEALSKSKTFQEIISQPPSIPTSSPIRKRRATGEDALETFEAKTRDELLETGEDLHPSS